MADKEALFIASDATTSVAWVDYGASNFEDAPAGYQVQPRTWYATTTGTVGYSKAFYQRR
jgi:hypothetical protein